MIEFPSDTKLGDLQDGITREDLIRAVNAMTDKLLSLIQDVPDSYVTFVPVDPDANDPYAADEKDVDLAWTLGHVIVHVAASCEESAARGATLARGVEVLGRSRYETPWQTVTATAQLVAQLEEMKAIWNDEAYGPGAADEITAQDVTDAGYTDISVAEFQSAMAQMYDILDNWKTAAKMAELRKVVKY